jgi:hypothetical protein
MEHVSPYTINAIGTHFPTGILDYSSQLKINDGKIDMENTLVFTDLESKAVVGELAAKLDNQLPIPLNLALSMLRDRDGTINLDIPVSGEMSNLHLGLTNIIITALSKGITVAVAPYLAYTFLGPLGAVAFVGAEVGESLLHTNLPVLKFEPGAKVLTAEHKKILNTIGKTIAEDKQSNYSICTRVQHNELSAADSATTTNEDVLQNEALRKKLFELGELRSNLVKSFLLSNFEINEKELLICNPGLEFKEGTGPTISFKKSTKKLDLQ